MTKDEAKAESSNVIKDYRLDREEVIYKVRDIIDQIDQPGEFSVRELVELLGQARDGIYKACINIEGDWAVSSAGWHHKGQGIDSLRSKLFELAKPPEDPEVMVPMRLSLVKCCAEHLDGDIKLACKAALEKAKL